MDNSFAGRSCRQVAYFHGCKGHISNPGTGIVSMLISDHMIDAHTPEGRLRADKMPPYLPTREDFRSAAEYEYVDNLYLRVGWSDVQRAKGKLELSPLMETALEEIRRSGKTWSLRIMNNSPSNPQEHLVPEFLADSLPMVQLADEGEYYGGAKKMPRYTDDYLKYWDEMLHMLGERFDGDPTLAYADVSGYGFWGEGHHWGKIEGDERHINHKFGTDEQVETCVKRLIASHADAFPSTPMSVNVHLCDYKAGRDAIAGGAWGRRDSYYEWFKAEEAQFGLLRRPEAGFVFETIVPSAVRPERTAQSGNGFRSFLEMPGLECDYGCNYAVIGFNPPDTIYGRDNAPELFESFSERIGYRLRPSIVWLTGDKAGRKFLTLGMINDGCANAPGTLTFTAAAGAAISSVKVSGGDIFGRMRIIDLPLPEADCDTVQLSAALTTGQKTAPVRWATDCADGHAPYNLTIKIK